MSEIPDPFKNYTMKGANAPKVQEQAIAKIDPSDLQAVKAMTWEKLVRTMELMPPGAPCLPIGRELLDRMEGRPVQRTDSRVLTQTKGEIVIKLVD